MRPNRDYCFEPDEEILAMEIEYAKNALTIHQLEAKLHHLQRANALASGRRKHNASNGPKSPFRTNGTPLSPLTGGAVMSSDSDEDAAVGEDFEETMKFSFHQPPPGLGRIVANVDANAEGAHEQQRASHAQVLDPTVLGNIVAADVLPSRKTTSADSDNSGGDVTNSDLQGGTRESSV